MVFFLVTIGVLFYFVFTRHEMHEKQPVFRVVFMHTVHLSWACVLVAVIFSHLKDGGRCSRSHRGPCCLAAALPHDITPLAH